MTTTTLKPEPLDSFGALEELVLQVTHVSLLSDFDGTLSPIVAVPGDAELDRHIRPLLKQLVHRPDVSVAIISGRALEDVRKRTGIEGAIYAGNHGLEIEAGEIRFRNPEAEALRRELKCVLLQLGVALDGTEGVEIEDKGLTLSVHYRRVDADMQDWVLEKALETAAKYHSFTTRKGKKVLEIRPRLEWDKGHAIKWLLKEVLPSGTLPIYIGDDATDEDAFAAIPQGITIRVGGIPTEGTQARYLLADIHSVARFLSWLNHARPNASTANAKRVGK